MKDEYDFTGATRGKFHRPEAEMVPPARLDATGLVPVAQAIANAQALARQHTADVPETSVDAFLANRRADSGE